MTEGKTLVKTGENISKATGIKCGQIGVGNMAGKDHAGNGFYRFSPAGPACEDEGETGNCLFGDFVGLDQALLIFPWLQGREREKEVALDMIFVFYGFY